VIATNKVTPGPRRADRHAARLLHHRLCGLNQEKDMRSGIVSVAAGISMALFSGFGAIGTVSLAQDAGNARLPVGSTLLGADDTACNGDLVLESGITRANDRERRIGQGQHALFQVDSGNIGWSCADSERSDTMECPSETTHVRIARSERDNVVRFECYGSTRDR
jgi:hypothetical protein